jgi:hypothetical protein
MNYFIKTNKGFTGPHNHDELGSLHVSKDTLIWYEGLFGWTKAAELLEFSDLVNEKKEPSKKTMAQLFDDINFNLNSC